jgi:hypothetical protein
MASNIKSYKAWFESSNRISDIAKLLEQAEITKNSKCGYENVYEWFEADTSKRGVWLNVSRKHCDFENFENEPVHVMLMYTFREPDDEVMNKLTQSIANTINVPVSLGSIEHKGEDNFEYNQTRSINS